MYEAFDDPYCYPGTLVLRNRLGLKDPEALEAFETEISTARAAEPLPRGRLSVTHYRAVHRHLFQDVYNWAGEFRTVRIAKGGNAFCFPEYIAPEMAKLFARLRGEAWLRDRDTITFVDGATAFLSALNQIHPFREGNGRTQLAFLAVLADRAGHRLEFDRLRPDAMLHAMIASFHDETDPLRVLLAALVAD
ncbi:Fic family protein [Brevundimonas sp. SORGH_AS_0993]|uniref:Fic/DOC family protein n=1 Tax=Brevundimonas sp. SORGH_AS_0993 TaxID=3041794 RepID=UPI002788F807|nr:Fic family protein [Brevundimonas sp. SORGH_AS_0993]MDQ1153441.1 cell filamentation protein [Brevundimonas sp. SORGH_AS_0993]